MLNRPLPPMRMKIAQVMLGIGLLGIVAELVTGDHWILPGSVALAIGGALLGLNRVVCPKCGFQQTAICAEIKNCEVCKTAFSAEAKANNHTASRA